MKRYLPRADRRNPQPIFGKRRLYKTGASDAGARLTRLPTRPTRACSARAAHGGPPGSDQRLPIVVANRFCGLRVPRDAAAQRCEHCIILSVIRLVTQDRPTPVSDQDGLTSFLQATEDLERASFEVRF